MTARIFIFLFASAGIMASCNTPGATVASSRVVMHPIVSGCSIFSSDGTLLWSYPRWLCAFFPDGRFLSGDDGGLTLHGPDQNVLWHKTFTPHHMVTIAKNGDVLVLTSEMRKISAQRPGFEKFIQANNGPQEFKTYDKVPTRLRKEEFRVDKIVRLSPSGEILGEHRFLSDKDFPLTILKHEMANLREAKADPVRGVPLDLEASHMNSIYELEPNDSKLPEFAAGNILVNDTLNRVVLILDPQLTKILWKFNFAELGYIIVHDVHVLPNGNLLLFRNSIRTDDSSLVEIVPKQNTVAWRYLEKTSRSFHASLRGSVQPLSGERLLYAYTNDDSKRNLIKIINREGDLLWSLDLSSHSDVTMQGAYELPVEAFLQNNRRR